VNADRLAPVDLWSQLLWACRAAWRELPGILLVSVAWSLALVPSMLALAAGAPELALLAALPLLIATTGLFGSLAIGAAGGSVRLPHWDAFDPGLGLAGWGCGLVVIWSSSAGAVGLLIASVVGALAVLVLPVAAAYGAVRGCRGETALRGGMVIAAVRPSLALSVTAGACLAAFACVASAGTLVVVAPAFVALVACRTVRVALRIEGPSADESWRAAIDG
jgi:hypothetical protein